MLKEKTILVDISTYQSLANPSSSEQIHLKDIHSRFHIQNFAFNK